MGHWQNLNRKYTTQPVSSYNVFCFVLPLLHSGLDEQTVSYVAVLHAIVRCTEELDTVLKRLAATHARFTAQTLSEIARAGM
jgi:hypothetical protein